ncbi:S1 RNA-binding domain-containing protein [Marinicrinis lubricantis]|uniref:S1 RNA-binding domain-containing protein n=1 Tax=Marinicrinis lubricantis TaxID=2086470 RepID=A0ABW1IV19_9BACL
MSLQAGQYKTLKVNREKSPYGYFLGDGEHEVLLHYSEIEGSIEMGQELKVFLFHDSEDRLAATMREPLLTLGETGLLTVVDIHPRFGCYLEMGLSRHLLLPYKQLPEEPEYRPMTGDEVFVTLSTDKQGRMIGKLAGEQELSRLTFRAPDLWKNQWLPAIVYNTLKMGSFVLVEGGKIGFGALGFIHESERTKPLRIGEKLEVRITFVREDGRVNCSMRQRKEKSRDEDSDRLYEFLKARPNGAMPYSDETPAEIIKERFQMSKGAFKRALGKLMKEGKVVQKGSWTHLAENEEAEVKQ